MTLTRDKMFDRMIKLSKRKITEKIARIEVSHQKSLTVKPEDIVRDDDPTTNRWFVKSSSSSLRYTIFLIHISCSEPLCRHKCKPCAICIHNFQCSCPDNTIYLNLCRHIHAVKRSSTVQINEINNNIVNEGNIVQEMVQFLPVDNNENKRNKQRIQALLENVLSSIAIQDCTEEQYKLLENYDLVVQ